MFDFAFSVLPVADGPAYWGLCFPIQAIATYRAAPQGYVQWPCPSCRRIFRSRRAWYPCWRWSIWNGACGRARCLDAASDSWCSLLESARLASRAPVPCVRTTLMYLRSEYLVPVSTAQISQTSWQRARESHAPPMTVFRAPAVVLPNRQVSRSALQSCYLFQRRVVTLQLPCCPLLYSFISIWTAGSAWHFLVFLFFEVS